MMNYWSREEIVVVRSLPVSLVIVRSVPTTMELWNPNSNVVTTKSQMVKKKNDSLVSIFFFFFLTPKGSKKNFFFLSRFFFKATQLSLKYFSKKKKARIFLKARIFFFCLERTRKCFIAKSFIYPEKSPFWASTTFYFD